jgi:hypothetical protein
MMRQATFLKNMLRFGLPATAGTYGAFTFCEYNRRFTSSNFGARGFANRADCNKLDKE